MENTTNQEDCSLKSEKKVIDLAQLAKELVDITYDFDWVQIYDSQEVGESLQDTKDRLAEDVLDNLQTFKGVVEIQQYLCQIKQEEDDEKLIKRVKYLDLILENLKNHYQTLFSK